MNFLLPVNRTLSLLLILLATSVSQWLNAQDTTHLPAKKIKLSIVPHAGFFFPSSEIRDHFAVRQDINAFYDNDQSGGMLGSFTYGSSTGLSVELSFPKAGIGLSTGVRYSIVRSKVSGSVNNSSDFLYLRYGDSSEETRFARIRSMDETNSFLLIPFEVRYNLVQQQYFSLFARLGAEIGFIRLSHETSIDFHNPEMAPFEEEVLKSVEIPTDNFFSTAYASFGAEFSRNGKTGYIFEVTIPGTLLSNNNFNLVKTGLVPGFRLAVCIPLTPNK